MTEAANNSSISKSIRRDLMDSSTMEAADHEGSPELTLELELKEKRLLRFIISLSQPWHAPEGTYFTSPEFVVGGHEWCIHYYPNGDGTDRGDPGIFILNRSSRIAVAAATLTMQNVCGNPSAYSEKFGPHIFSGKGCSDDNWGWANFVGWEELEKCVQNDSLAMELDMAVYDYSEILN